jgi:hypothetical protein
LRAVQLLLGRTRIENGVEVDDALRSPRNEIAEKIDV